MLERLTEIWEQKHNRTLPAYLRPNVVFSQRRCRCRRGTANYGQRCIILYPAGQTVGTAVHELAHFIGAIYNDRGHGKVFKRVHLELLVMLQKNASEFVQYGAEPTTGLRPTYRGGDGLQLVLQLG